MEDVRDWVAAGFVVLGLVVMSIGVFGVLRMPDLATRMHAASKSVVFGVCSLAVAVALRSDPKTAARAALIAVMMLLTTPVASYAIARAARRSGEFGKPGAKGSPATDLDLPHP